MHFNAFDYIPFGTATLAVIVIYILDRVRAGKDASGKRGDE